MPTKPPPGEQDAVERFLNTASEESFEELFREFAPPIVHYFRIRGCDLDLAEDLTQEVMLAVYKAHGTLRSKDRFRSWLYRIARNVLLRHFRDASRRVATTELGASSEEVCEPAADPYAASEFADWMAWLNLDERQIMMLRYVDGLEHHEIAAVLGIPLGTAQWKVFRATKKLAAHFGARVV
jgi:RNA polymerase sigma-70 factor (ECF subfamily)